jgi:AsmA protein
MLHSGTHFPKQKVMSRILKLAALTAGVILLLLLAAAAIVGARVDPNDYKADMVRLVRERHQRILAIPGTIRLTLYPRIGADLGKVTLSEHAASGEFAAVDSARVSVALGPLLLRREVVIDRIDVAGMRARVIRYADGSMNTGDLTSGAGAQGATTGGSGGAAPVRLAIDSIRVTNARVLFDDRKSGRLLDISHLQIDSGPVARGVESRVALSANLRVNRPALSTALTLKGSFLPDRARRRIAFSEVEANLDLSFKDAKVKLKGALDVDLDKDEFAADLKGSFDASVFDLETGFQDKAYHLTLHVDKLDLGRYQDRLVPDAVPGDPAILEAGDAFDLSSLAILRASGGVHVGELTVGTMRATNVRAALRSDAGKFVLEPIGASVYGGSGSGSLTLDFSRSASTPHITFVQHLKAIEAGALLKDMLGRSPLEGRGDLLIDVNTKGASTLQMRQALAGTATLRLADGTLNGVDIGAMILGAQAASGLVDSRASTGFEQLGASFTIADGIAHNADLALRAPLFSAAGAGDIDLGREQIDYTLACTLGATGLTLPVKLSGPWHALAWRVDSKAVSGAAVKEKARDKLKKAIRGLLKR